MIKHACTIRARCVAATRAQEPPRVRAADAGPVSLSPHARLGAELSNLLTSPCEYRLGAGCHEDAEEDHSKARARARAAVWTSTPGTISCAKLCEHLAANQCRRASIDLQ